MAWNQHKYRVNALNFERIYNRDMENGGFFPDAFSAAIISAGSRARLETLEAGIPVSIGTGNRISM